MELLQGLLQEEVWQRADATVVLSNHFVRYAVVPWSEQLVSEEERQAWVSHQFTELYGEAAEPAQYRWSDGPPDAACAASAVERELISAIRAVFEPTSLRLRSIQPYLMAVFNQCRRQLKRGRTWIVVAERGRVCIAAISNGQWRAITSASLVDDWPDLAAHIERRLLLAGDEMPSVVFSHGIDVSELDTGNESPLRFETLALRPLPGYSPSADPEYRMALSGIA
jgi:hypothetical protein